MKPINKLIISILITTFFLAYFMLGCEAKETNYRFVEDIYKVHLNNDHARNIVNRSLRAHIVYDKLTNDYTKCFELVGSRSAGLSCVPYNPKK